MNFMESISILISSILSSRVIDAFVQVAPFTQATVDVVFIRIELTA